MRVILKYVVTFAALTGTVAHAGAPKPTSATKPAGEQLMYLATWPHTIRVIDINSEKVIDNIELPTDIARTLVLSPDKTKLYASTLRDNCIVTINLKTRKVVDSFSLNTPTEQNRLGA